MGRFELIKARVAARKKLRLDYNENHDPQNGEFSTGAGGGGSGSGGDKNRHVKGAGQGVVKRAEKASVPDPKKSYGKAKAADYQERLKEARKADLKEKARVNHEQFMKGVGKGGNFKGHLAAPGFQTREEKAREDKAAAGHAAHAEAVRIQKGAIARKGTPEDILAPTGVKRGVTDYTKSTHINARGEEYITGPKFEAKGSMVVKQGGMTPQHSGGQLSPEQAKAMAERMNATRNKLIDIHMARGKMSDADRALYDEHLKVASAHEATGARALHEGRSGERNFEMAGERRKQAAALVNKHLQPASKEAQSGGMKIHTKEEFEKTVKEGSFSVLTAANPRSQATSSQENADRMKSLYKDLKARGATYTPTVGKYGSVEPSVMVNHDEHFSAQDARDLGTKYGQTSVLHSEKGQGTVYYTTGPRAGKSWSSTGLSIGSDKTDYFTGHQANRFSYDFPDEAFPNEKGE